MCIRDRSIEDGDFFENEALVEAMKNAAADGRALHLMGLLSDGGVHSHKMCIRDSPSTAPAGRSSSRCSRAAPGSCSCGWTSAPAL